MSKSVVANAAVSLTLQSTEFSKAVGTAKSEAKSLSATMREESNKSRESVRLLSEELSLGIPRGLQKIISASGPVRAAMQYAFDGVVVFALINTVLEVTNKIAEYGKKTEEAARKHKEAWGSVAISLAHQNDSLQVTSDNLQKAIDKLEHKPHNGLKDAIDEARAASDKLGEDLDQSIAKISAALEAEQPGTFARIFTQAGTYLDGPKKLIDDLQDQLRDIELGKSSVKGDTKDEQRRNVLSDARTRAEKEGSEAHVQSGTFQATAPEYVKKEKDQYKGIDADISTSIDKLDLQNHISEQQKKLDADNAANTAREAAKTADDKFLKDKQDALKKLEAVNAMSLDQEKAYWDAIEKIAPSAGSKKLVGLQIDDVQIQINKKYQSDYLRQLDKDIADKRTADNKNIEEHTPPGGNETWETMQKASEESAEIAKKAQRDIYESTVADLQTKEKLAELLVKIQEANHELSKSQAAQQLQAIHAQTDAATLDAFGKAQNAGAQFDLKQGIQLQGEITERSVNDAQARAQETFSSKMTSDLDDWIEKSTNLGDIMSNLFTTSINQVNDAIIKILTEKNSGQHPFRQAGHAIFTDVSKEGLQSAEGSLFKLFGKSGKDVQKVQVVNWPHVSGPGGSGGGPDGAGTGILGMLNRSNWAGNLFGGKLFGPGGIFDRGQPGISGPGSGGPINQGGAPLSMDNVSDFAPGAPGWVGQMTKYAGIALGAGLGAIEKGAQAPGDSGDDGDSAPGSGSTMQGIPITGSFQGVEAHASGGLLSANTWSLVGENGPELLPPVGQTTRVYDARDTSAMLGGGGNTTNHSWNIDARGSTDPAAVHAAVIRGIKQAAPQLISSAHASSNDHKARKPSSAR